eukprot:6924112-Pyramimonas_sp.AAC.1
MSPSFLDDQSRTDRLGLAPGAGSGPRQSIKAKGWRKMNKSDGCPLPSVLVLRRVRGPVRAAIDDWRYNNNQ